MVWAVALTKPNSERQVGRGLDRIGISFYLPIYRDRVSRHRRLLLPCYIFITVPLEWQRIFRVYGVRRLFLTGEELPYVVSDKYIDTLKDSECKDGVVTLPSYRHGQRLRVLRGQFQNMLATYDGKRIHRQREYDVALVELMGRKVRVEFEPDQLAAA